jgi:hypothetical protein
MRLVVLGLLVSASLFGCAPRLERGAPCVRSGECPTPLACLSGRCLEQCLVQNDCPAPARCLEVEGLGRCLFDEENLCATSDDCGGSGLICQGGHCFNTCERCAALGAVCEDSVCVRVESVDASVPDVGMVDAGSDAGRDGGGAPLFEAHRPCIDGMDCRAGEECRADDGASRFCREPCVGPPPDAGMYPAEDRECPSQICVRPEGDFSSAFCALTCDALDVSSCPGGERCMRVDRLRPNTGDTRYLWGCVPMGTPSRPVDGPCDGAPEFCPAGTLCSGFPAACLPLCDVSSPSCPDARLCLRVHSDDEGFPVGTCQPLSGSADAGP